MHPIPRGPRAAIGTGLVAAATCSSVLALQNLIVRGTWLSATWFIVLVVAAIVMGVRAVTRSWWAPSLAGLVVSLAIILVRYGAAPGRVRVLPDTGSVDRTLATAREGITVINASLVPMQGVRSTELLVVTGALAVFLLADLLAIGVGAPALSGLAFATMWIPAVVLGFPASGWALAWTALCYLLLLALSTAPATAHADQGRRASVAVFSSVGLIVATVVAGPVVASLPGWASVSLPTFGSGPVGPLQLSDDLDLRQSLGSRSGQVVMRYTVKAAAPAAGSAAPTPAPSSSSAALGAVSARAVGPLRAFTLASFDGSSWQRTDAPSLAPWDPATLLTSDPGIVGTAPDPERGTLADVAIDVAGLRERRLPISTFPRTVAVDGSWQYDAARDEVVGRRSTYNGMQYAMQVEIPNLTKADLQFANVGDPGDDGATLEVPKTSHSDDIAKKARELTADATTPYQQAMDLQQFFHSTANFTYDTHVAPSRSDDAVWDFLQSTHGYCVQFATSMTIMARMLGIPARVAVGFLPGDPDDSGTYIITGRQSHAWPELYFQNYGWVRFEPTPASQTGPLPAWSDPFSGVSSTKNSQEEQFPGSNTTPTTAPVPVTQQNGTTVQQSTNAWLPVGITVAVVLVVASIALVLVRRRAGLLPDLTPERAWSRARRRLAKRGIVWSDADTPRTVVASVNAQLRTRTGSELSGEPAAALVSLARTVETERYAREHPDVQSGVLSGWVDELVGGAEQLLSDRSRRDAVPSAPRDGS
ncbi:transglutaminase TgpA family protein [Cellulomonas sp. McL0617]|uniref:transglutaminase TgpA family protein n=1 Tax=Cellulomonas sp. McL0617 TaxID=3415675 RepID=UPI003CF01882